MNINSHEISQIIKNSPAERAGIVAGDKVLSINEHELIDIFDYHYYSYESEFDIQIQHIDGSLSKFHIVKNQDEDLGIIFSNGLMDDYKSCHNKCIFCFIDQMPPGMRETLYFKDDDTRLSFLQGNYVTLTNMKMADLDRIIAYNLGPINISVHTTNPELRVKMLNNRFAGDILEKIKKLYDAGIPMNAQIVACPGINDGKELDRTISDLLEFAPVLESLSVVPVGITKFREGLYPLRPYTKDEARKVISQVEAWQNKAYAKLNSHFVQASDEWYITAEQQLPETERYDGFIQLENGVGMLRLLQDEVEEYLQIVRKPLFLHKKRLTIACGKLAASYIQKICDMISTKFPKISVQVIPITNNYFGENITVTGLITATDLIEQLKGKDLGDALLLSINMLRSGEDVFLDDITLSELSQTLQVPIRIVQSDGQDFVDKVISK